MLSEIHALNMIQRGKHKGVFFLPLSCFPPLQPVYMRRRKFPKRYRSKPFALWYLQQTKVHCSCRDDKIFAKPQSSRSRQRNIVQILTGEREINEHTEMRQKCWVKINEWESTHLDIKIYRSYFGLVTVRTPYNVTRIRDGQREWWREKKTSTFLPGGWTGYVLFLREN